MTLLWIGLVVAAFAVRLVVLAVSVGTDDAKIWWGHGFNVLRFGFAGNYAQHELLNHPPIVLIWSTAVSIFSAGPGQQFAIPFKVPLLAADVLTTVVLYRVWKRRTGNGWPAAAAWAWCPTSILIGQYHCNTDGVIAGLTLLAAHLLYVRRPGWAGLALAAAVNVKIVPILLLPLLAAACRDWRAVARFAAAFAAGMLPFAIGFALAGRPFVKNIFGYQGYPGGWGLGLLLNEAAVQPGLPAAVRDVANLYLTNGRHAVLAAIGLLSLAAWAMPRRWDTYQLAAIGTTAFLVFSPAFAAQYAVIPVAALMATGLRRGTLYGLVAGVMLAVVYAVSLVPGFPLRSDLSGGIPPIGLQLNLLVWGSLVGCLMPLVFGPGERKPMTTETAPAVADDESSTLSRSCRLEVSNESIRHRGHRGTEAGSVV